MKRSAIPEHPIRRWRRLNDISPEDFEKLVSSNGGQLTHRSLGEIELGRRRPSYELAKIIARVTQMKLTVDQLLTWKRNAQRGAA